jgi:exosortase/archaeosortase family protein
VTSGALPERPAGSRHQHRADRGHRRAQAEATAARRSVSRLPVSAALGFLAYLAVRENVRIRGFEAWLASHVIAVGAHVQTGDDAGFQAVWFLAKRTQRVGLIITPECTVGLLMVPFLIAGALLVWQRVPLRWPLTGLVVALGMLIMVNQIRLLTIVWFVKGMGFSSGFYWGHTMAGSIITIVGLATSLAVFAMLAVRRRNSARR